jgi:dynein heavy chain 1, cytosolic
LVQGQNGVLSPVDAPHLDPQVVVDYIRDVLQLTLGASDQDLTANGSILSETRLPDTVKRCTRFAQESQVALYIQKEHLKDAPEVVENGNHRMFLVPPQTCRQLTFPQYPQPTLSTPSPPSSPTPPM